MWLCQVLQAVGAPDTGFLVRIWRDIFCKSWINAGQAGFVSEARESSDFFFFASLVSFSF